MLLLTCENFERSLQAKITGHFCVTLKQVFNLFIYSLQEQNHISYHLLWIKLYVPLILKPCLYLLLLEEDNGVHGILIYIYIYIILILSVPNIFECMLHLI